MERSRTFSLEDGHCKLQEVQRSAITNCHTGVTTEIAVQFLRVCKWQYSFTFRSAGKTDYGMCSLELRGVVTEICESV